MRTLEVRRHSFTKKGEARGKGSHLSVEGVAQAHSIGQELGPFDLILTSRIPRTLETALAMGFAVNEQIEDLGEIPSDVWEEIGHQERWSWQDPFTVLAEIVSRGGPTARMGQRQREIWTQALDSTPEGGSVLIISHGRVIEAGLVACVPDGNFSTWGSPFHHGEGVRMRYEACQFMDVQFRRLT